MADDSEEGRIMRPMGARRPGVAVFVQRLYEMLAADENADVICESDQHNGLSSRLFTLPKVATNPTWPLMLITFLCLPVHYIMCHACRVECRRVSLFLPALSVSLAEGSGLKPTDLWSCRRISGV